MAAFMDIQQIYISVVEQGSFNKASEILGITQPTVSKRIDMLEDRLGIKLLKRSTRQLILTPAGERYYERSKQIRDLIGKTEKEIRHVADHDDNLLRISASLSVASIFLPPALVTLHDQRPTSRFRLETNIDFGHYYKQQYQLEHDLFLHEGESADTKLVSRRLASIPVGIYVSPEYLQKHGTPRDLDELASTGKCIGSRVMKSNLWSEKLLPNLDMSVFNFMLTGNEGLSLVQYAEAGMGFVFAAEHLVKAALEEGTVVKIDIDSSMKNLPLNALYRKEYLTPLASSCMDILSEHHVDLVLADLNMPVMSGMELINNLRGNEATKSIPVVIISTESSQVRIEKLLTDGAKDYLHKPFTPEKLREIITRTVGA